MEVKYGASSPQAVKKTNPKNVNLEGSDVKSTQTTGMANAFGVASQDIQKTKAASRKADKD